MPCFRFPSILSSACWPWSRLFLHPPAGHNSITIIPITPPQGAAHDHRFNDIDQAVKMFESAERDTWQKPDEVVKQLAITRR